MTKLSYAGRRTSGIKMGALVQKDIMKRIPDYKKQSASKDSSLELILSGKNLGDDGLLLVCEALQEAIKCGAIHLEELNLSGNALTAASLQALSFIIRNQPDLKDIDLSKNDITIGTVEDAQLWQIFLESFEHCRCLRRIDLSSNPLKDKAMEIFLSVYSSQPSIVLSQPNRDNARTLDINDDYNDEEDSFEIDRRENLENPKSRNGKHRRDSVTGLRRLSINPLLTKSGSRKLSGTSTNDNDQVPAHNDLESNRATTIQGLRSIPYIILTNTNITDTSALWLSVLLPYHAKPWEILPHFPPFKDQIKEMLLQKYHTDRECKGIIWSLNSELTSHGLKALAIAEGIRGWNNLDECCFTTAKTLRTSDKRKANETSENVFWPWSMYGPPRDTINILCDPEAPPPIYDTRSHTPVTLQNELDRTRLKIQGNVLRENGPRAVLLWNVVLRMLIISRAILLDFEGPITLENYENLSSKSRLSSHVNRTNKNSSTNLNDISSSEDCDASNTEESSLGEDFPPLSCLETPVKSFNTNSSGVSSVHSTPMTEMNSSPTASVRTTQLSPRARFYIETGSRRRTKSPSLSAIKQNNRENKLPMNLPAHLWLKIIAMAEDPLDLTSSEQRFNIADFARSRESLVMEREILGKLTSFQIRKVLETVDGLVYQVRK